MAQDISIPALERTITLSSVHSQKVLARSYKRTAQALYNADVMVRIVAGAKEAEQLEEVVHSMVNDVENDLTKDFEKRSAELEKYGINALPAYNSPQTETLKISSPHVGRYVQVLVLFDEYLKQTDALWLAGALTNGERDGQAYDWQKRLNRFSSRLIQLESRAMRSAQRQAEGKQDKQESSNRDQAKGEPKAD